MLIVANSKHANFRMHKNTERTNNLLQITNSTHSPNTFISNQNTPNECSQTHINVCKHMEFRPPQNRLTVFKTSQIAQLTTEIKNQYTQANKRLQTTSNSTHLHNIFISNENTPNICSQTHVNICIRNSVHHKTSQIAQPTVEIKNQHAHKKKISDHFQQHALTLYIH